MNRIENRREFLSRSAAVTTLGTAASRSRVPGANDRVRVANVGCGRRGLLKELLQLKDTAGIEVAAVCDIWRQKREQAAGLVKEFTGQSPPAVAHLEQVLQRKDIDAVVIGTPDHLHCAQLVEAIRAGKDVYVEKPLAMNMRELVRAHDAVKKSGRIVQIGTQMRSYPQAQGLRQFLAAGELGRTLKVVQARNGYSPYWMSYGGDAHAAQKPAPEDVEWKAFLGDRKSRPFDSRQFQNWYGYREFSRGPHTNLMVHFIDLVHYVNGLQFPKRVVALGNTFRWKEAYDAPDSVEVALEYPEGLMVRYTTVFGNGAGSYAKWFGTRGTVDARNLSARETWTASGEGSQEPDKLAAAVDLPRPETTHHMQNWIECIRSRREPIAPIEAGFAHSVAIILADEAMMSGRRMSYDAARREVIPG